MIIILLHLIVFFCITEYPNCSSFSASWWRGQPLLYPPPQLQSNCDSGFATVQLFSFKHPPLLSLDPPLLWMCKVLSVSLILFAKKTALHFPPVNVKNRMIVTNYISERLRYWNTNNDILACGRSCQIASILLFIGWFCLVVVFKCHAQHDHLVKFQVL